jgi:hypothetical protein
MVNFAPNNYKEKIKQEIDIITDCYVREYNLHEKLYEERKNTEDVCKNFLETHFHNITCGVDNRAGEIVMNRMIKQSLTERDLLDKIDPTKMRNFCRKRNSFIIHKKRKRNNSEEYDNSVI